MTKLSYKDLEIYTISFELFIKVHQFSLLLPKHELYELVSQVRRASNSVNTNIVEGYGRKKYRKDFIKFLVYAQASNDETTNHLRILKRLYPQYEDEICGLIKEYELLGGKLNNFIRYVECNWRT